jgi:hypothetical protein
MQRAMTVLTSALLLAGCSSLSCELPEAKSATSVGSSSHYSSVQPQRSLGYSAQTRAEDDDIVGSIPPDSAKAATKPGAPNRNSVFVLENPKLFSATEDRRPWPFAGSPEANKQEEEDERREREINKVVEICRC